MSADELFAWSCAGDIFSFCHVATRLVVRGQLEKLNSQGNDPGRSDRSLFSALMVGNFSEDGPPDYGKSFAICMTAAALIWVFDAIRIVRGARASPLDLNKPGADGISDKQWVRWSAVTAITSLASFAGYTYLRGEFIAADVENLTRSLPKQLDHITTLTDAKFDGRQTTYWYVVDTDRQPFDSAAARKRFIQHHCSWRIGRYAPYFKYSRNYRDKLGKYLVAFSNSDCR